MYQVKECLELMSSLSKLDTVEAVSLNASLGRVLAQDIVADTDQPPFNKSAMDGYACNMADLPGPLIIAGEIAAGYYAGSKLASGHCYRIFTGAPVPEGADCVVMQEYTSKDSNGNIITTEHEIKSNICYRGEDIKIGDVAIKAGTVIGPQHIAVMAGFGVTQPRVAVKPRVGILCSGTELIEPDEKPDGAMIRNSNAYQLISQISAAGAEAEYLGIVTDDKEIITKHIADTAGNYDVLIVTGGASVGDYDFMPSVLDSLGAAVHFQALNIQPGKPVLFATLNGKHIIGLSGNPVSSFLQYHVVVKPLLYQLTGCITNPLKVVKALLAEPVKRKKSGRQLYVPVFFLSTGLVKPIVFHGSAHITALTGMDGFAILEPYVMEIPDNQLVDVLMV